MSSKNICILVGSVAISGGTYVIFQHATFLTRLGYRVTLAALFDFSSGDLSWHDEATTLRVVSLEEARRETFDIALATWWRTALELHSINAGAYGYFVQSIESRFYPASEVSLRQLVESTYELPIAYVTEAHWISAHLEKLGHMVPVVRNGIRKDVYQLEGPVVARRPREDVRFLVEGPFGVPFKNTALSLKLLHDAGASDVWLMTSSDVNKVPYSCRTFSRVPIGETAKIYRSCDVILKLSTVEGMFGPPLEMFHCGGTAIVFDVSGHDEYIVDGHNALVVKERNIGGVVAAIRSVIERGPLLEGLMKAATATASGWPSWDESSGAFARWVENATSWPQVRPQDLGEVVGKSFAVYEAAEKARLRRRPGVALQQRFARVASRLPASAKKMLRTAKVTAEVLSPGRGVR